MISTAGECPSISRPVKTLRSCLFILSLFPFVVAATDGVRKEEPLTHIGDIRSLSREEAIKALPVHVRAVVTWRGLRGQLIVQDDTGGCWIYVDEARRQNPGVCDEATLNSISVGQVLEIEGHSDPGSYAPGVMPTNVRIVGKQQLPSARPMNPTRFFSGSEANLRVEVRGVVQGFQPAETG